MTKERSINWYKLNRTLHRDIGYLCIGLTIVFAISGIALNHAGDWNPNYIVERTEKAFFTNSDLPDKQLNTELLALFPNSAPIKATYWESIAQYKLFFNDGGAITANFAKKTAVYEHIQERVIFKQFNTLHLNEAKKGWIVFSDIYAGLLIFLALSALFMVKGKYSAWSLRRGWLIMLGGLIPIIYIFF
ncbi:hypothetical protein [Colwellia sp. BRX10-4]|uniref:hypothetical protein n=1 Tax=Colwellia sp. BRX10-4 TaxID=2759843 RepID=UPI0015F59E89|nr:hypothetical protein [Colwellia sp. BRX10-4]MBA6396944.1 hypothetical protein [Colwellia sp. BRX10-4]